MSGEQSGLIDLTCKSRRQEGQVGFYFITNHRPQERAFHLNVQVNRRRLKEERKEGRKEGRVQRSRVCMCRCGFVWMCVCVVCAWLTVCVSEYI